jgi:tRNA1Val (adenine37-N6)-methyltransferase
VRRARVVVDLGSGVGAVTLALLHARAVERAVLVEIDARAAELARRNLADNGWAERGEVLCADVTRAMHEHGGRAQLVVCNPPYYAPGRGRQAAEPSRARARSGELGAFAMAARAFLGRRGRACFVYPAGELFALFGALRDAGLEPKRLRAVHGAAKRPARVVLVEAQPGKRGGLVIESPLFETE